MLRVCTLNFTIFTVGLQSVLVYFALLPICCYLLAFLVLPILKTRKVAANTLYVILFIFTFIRFFSHCPFLNFLTVFLGYCPPLAEIFFKTIF